MRARLIGCLITLVVAGGSAQTRTAEQVIRDEGVLILTEGGSYYRFNRDSSFDSGPIIGFSGRTIRGRWRRHDDVFIVEGQWSWINGVSPMDEYRRMTIRIARIDGAGTVQSILHTGVFSPVRVHRGYYYVDDVVRIPPPAGAARAVSADNATACPVMRRFISRIPGVDDVRWGDDGQLPFPTGSVNDLCALVIGYRAGRAPSALPPSQVWLLRRDGTVIAPTRAAAMTGDGFGGTGAPKASYLFDRTGAREAIAIVVKLGDEYLIEPLRR